MTNIHKVKTMKENLFCKETTESRWVVRAGVERQNDLIPESDV